MFSATVAKYLIALADDIRSGKPIESAIDELAEQMDEWQDELDKAEDVDDRRIDEICG